MKALLFALLLATSALAQPVIGPEVSLPPIELGDSAIAPLRDGFVAAWSDADRIHVAHLDSSLHATDPTLDLLLATSSSRVAALAIATNGSSVLVVWNEKRPGSAETYAATISPDARLLLHAPLLINNTNIEPVVRVEDGKYEILSGELLLVVNEQLQIEASTPIDASPLTRALGDSDELATVFMTPKTTCTFGWFATCSLVETFTFQSPSFSRAFPLAAKFYDRSYSPLLHDPIVIPYRDHFIGLLASQTLTNVFEMSPGANNTQWQLDPLQPGTTLAVASNDEDILLVTSAAEMVKGVFLHSDGSSSAPFLIAHGPYSEVKAFANGSNEFVVLYRFETSPQLSVLSARLVNVQARRERGVR